MEGKRRYFTQMRRRLSKCRKRLETLKKQGYHFSNDIYYDIESIEKKIQPSSFFSRLWKYEKAVSTVSILIIFAIIIISSIIADDTSESRLRAKNIIEIIIDDINNGAPLNKSMNISGKTSHSNGSIDYVQVKIDNGIWNNASGTTVWNYFFDITEISNGYHIIFVRSFDGETYSGIYNKTVKIEKSIPNIDILYPGNGADVKGIIHINGTTNSNDNQVRLVQINFNDGPWQNTTGTLNWSKNWDTKNHDNGIVFISVKCIDNIGFSESVRISVNVYNPPPDPIIEIPDITGRNKFQIFIFGSDELMLPNGTYELDGYHRKIENLFLGDTYTDLVVTQKEDWLLVSLPELPIITHPDYDLNTFLIKLSITDNAPMNRKIQFTITAYWGKPIIISNGFHNPINRQHFDITIYTGDW
jgi:hypothetical protein